MKKSAQSVFDQKTLYGWNLWRLITVLINRAVIATMISKDLSRDQDILSMNQFSVFVSWPGTR